MVTTAKGGKRKRGRPPTTSREAIVDMAVRLVTVFPERKLSIHELARTLKLSPTALYSHVADKDDLLQEVSTRILEDLAPSIVDEDPWSDQLATWARAVRDHFLRHPAMFRLLGWHRHMSATWLHHIAVLTRILKRSGLEKAALADAAVWASRALMGAISMEIEERDSHFRLAEVDMRQLSADDKATWAEILPFLPGSDGAHRYDAHIARVVTALEKAASTPHTAGREA